MDMTLFALGLFIIVAMTLAAVWRILFRKKRFKTLFMFIFGLIIMALATGFYAAIAFIGWKYVSGECYDDISSYKPTTAKIELNFDSTSEQQITEFDIQAILESDKIIPEYYECKISNDCLNEATRCKENLCKVEDLGTNECINDYDCGDVTTTGCNVNNTCIVVGGPGVECVTRNQCKIGFECENGKCTKIEELDKKVMSLLAFPRTFYKVKCAPTATKRAYSFNCTMEFTVPSLKKSSTSFETNRQTEQFLIREVNTRFQPATLDFVKVENEFLKKTELYNVEITRDDILEIDGVELEPTVEPPTELPTTETPTEEPPKTEPDTSGDGSGEGVADSDIAF